MWDGATLVYRVKLPLVREIDFWRYNIQSWPLPYNETGLAIQLRIEHNDVGLNPQTGEIFHPKSCTGRNPIVCRTGPIYKPGAWMCTRAILSGNKELRHTCEVELSHTNGLTKAVEIALGEYVLITWGEMIYTRCVSRPEESRKLPVGTYLITVRDKCSTSGKEWTLPGLVKRIGRISVRALKINDITPLDIQNVIPEGDALKELRKIKFNVLKPLSRVHLKPLIEPDPYIDWEQHGSHLSYGLLFILVSLIGVLIIIGICVKCKWPVIKAKWREMDERKDDTTRDKIVHPFTFFHNISLKDEGEVEDEKTEMEEPKPEAEP